MSLGEYSQEAKRALSRYLKILLIWLTLTILVTTVVIVIALALEPAVTGPVLGWFLVAVLGGILLIASLACRGVTQRLMKIGFAATLVCVILQVFLLDGIFGSVLAFLDGPTETTYASSYSEWQFRFVLKGTSRSRVLHVLGQPLAEAWIYNRYPGGSDDQVVFEGGIVSYLYGVEHSPLDHVIIAMRPERVLQVAGPPKEVVYSYTRGRNSFRVRLLRFRHNKVVEKISYYYVD